MEPAKSIVEKLGGETEIARAIGLPLPTPYSWTRSRKQHGCSGRIPQKHIPALLKMAKSRGVKLKLEDFFREGDTA